MINTTLNAIVKIGISNIFASIYIKFKLWKKNAIINVIEMVVAKLIAKLSATSFGASIFLKLTLIGLYNIVIPIMQAKLSKKLTSKAHNGFIKKITIPANDIAVNESYSFPKILARIKIKDIIPALTTETAKLHKNA